MPVIKTEPSTPVQSGFSLELSAKVNTSPAIEGSFGASGKVRVIAPFSKIAKNSDDKATGIVRSHIETVATYRAPYAGGKITRGAELSVINFEAHGAVIDITLDTAKCRARPKIKVVDLTDDSKESKKLAKLLSGDEKAKIKSILSGNDYALAEPEKRKELATKSVLRNTHDGAPFSYFGANQDNSLRVRVFASENKKEPRYEFDLKGNANTLVIDI